MPSREPLRPAPSGDTQPPVGVVRRLVERSGFVVYEPGTTLFNESVLVYVARPKRREWPGFDVYDHLGRPMATIRREVASRLSTTRGPCNLFDRDGARLLRIEPRFHPFKPVIDVSGIAEARFSSGTTIFAGLTISANREPFGRISGDRLRGLHGRGFTIQDHNRTPVGAIRIDGDGLFRKHVESYVVRLDTGLDGPLRRLILAAPPVLAMVRRAQHQV